MKIDAANFLQTYLERGELAVADFSVCVYDGFGICDVLFGLSGRKVHRFVVNIMGEKLEGG